MSSSVLSSGSCGILPSGSARVRRGDVATASPAAEGELASAATTEKMLDVLRGQFYDSRLPRFIKEQAQVAHKAGEGPPYVLNDAGIIFHEGGPTVVTVFVNQNKGTVLEVEEVIGQIAKDLVSAWGDEHE